MFDTYFQSVFATLNDRHQNPQSTNQQMHSTWHHYPNFNNNGHGHGQQVKGIQTSTQVVPNLGHWSNPNPNGNYQSSNKHHDMVSLPMVPMQHSYSGMIHNQYGASNNHHNYNVQAVPQQQQHQMQQAPYHEQDSIHSSFDHTPIEDKLPMGASGDDKSDRHSSFDSHTHTHTYTRFHSLESGSPRVGMAIVAPQSPKAKERYYNKMDLEYYYYDDDEDGNDGL